MGAPKFDRHIGQRIRWRSYDRADDSEKNIAELLVEDWHPGRHDPARMGDIRFSKQRLFVDDPSLQSLIVIPSRQAGHPFFYIIYYESADNPAEIGDNIISEPLLNIHSRWIENGAKVLTTVLDGQWAAYIYSGEAYILHTPSFESLRDLQEIWRKSQS